MIQEDKKVNKIKTDVMCKMTRRRNKMKKRLLSLVLGIIVMLSAFPVGANAADSVAINKVNFPDDAFRNYVSSKVDTDADQFLSEAEIAAVKDINVDKCSIEDLKGIEFFTSLIYLSCANNLLTELDMSGNSKLIKLNCSYNKLTSINVSQNLNLSNLDVSENQLYTLDVTNNPLLGELACSWNQLSALDLKNNPNLGGLICLFNQIEVLDLSGKSNLMMVYATYNRISQLDLTGCMRLQYLDVSMNCLSKFDFTNDSILQGGGTLEYNNQSVFKEINKTAGGWLLNIAELVGKKDLSNVKFNPREEKDWSYDKSTGIACYTGNKLPGYIHYNYGDNMSIMVKLLPVQNFVVMKEGAEQAVVNGTLAPTTKYATGYAKMVNINGTMQMPLRYIGEVNKFDIRYEESKNKIGVISPAGSIDLLFITPGSQRVEKYAWVDIYPAVSQAPLPFTIQNGVTMGPLRFTCEAMGLSVYYKETAHGNYVVISPVAKTPEEALEKIEEAYQLGL